MPKPTLDELLVPFKAKQDAYAFAASLVSERQEARLLLAASVVHPLSYWRCPSTRTPTDEKVLWLWIWSGFDGGPQRPKFLASLAAAAGISVEAAFRVWPVLMASRTLYPDGTLSNSAKLMLNIPIAHGPGRPRIGEKRMPAVKIPDDETKKPDEKKDEGTDGDK